ncbi:MAG TPA: hypothetical protein VEF04_14355, partial [Blastocatellia bacterium]|nr:hypothetical protein [Blastocatellia bacterium]
MPIDPSIPLSGARLPAASSPIDVMGKMMTLRGMMDDQRIRQMQISTAERQLEQERQLREAFRKGDFSPQTIYGIMGPVAGVEIMKGFEAMRDMATKRTFGKTELIARFAGAAKRMPTPALKREAYDLARTQLLNDQFLGFRPEEIPPAYAFSTDEELDKFLDLALTQALTPEQQIQAGEREIERADRQPERDARWLDNIGRLSSNVNDQAGLNQLRNYLITQNAPPHIISMVPTKFDDNTRVALEGLGMTAQQKVSADRVGGEWERELERYAREHGYGSADDVPEAERLAHRRKWSESGAASTRAQAQNDADLIRAREIADEIEAGRQPPILTRLGRLSPLVQAELGKRDYNLAQAQSEYNATQRFLSSLNGPQQLRLRQAVHTVSHSLELIEQLGEAWEGGNFPILNRARIAAAKSGNIGGSVRATIMGETKDWTAAEIATLLEAQIADL